MTNLLQQGAEWLATMVERHASEPVTYFGDGDTVELNASVSRQAHEVDDGQGFVTVVEAYDFLIPAGDLVLNGSRALPKRGHQIDRTLHGVIERYEVMSLGSEDVYRFADPFGRLLRVHTKYVGGVA